MKPTFIRIQHRLLLTVLLPAPPLLAQEQEAAQLTEIDPTPHLPSLPLWFYLIVALFGLLLIAGLVLLILHLTKQKIIPATSRNSLQLAREHILRLKDQSHTLPLPRLATELSLTLRRYLADSKSDRSLFQTREEFLANQKRLHTLPDDARQSLTNHLLALAEHQYAPPKENPDLATQLIASSLACLEKAAHEPPSDSAHA